MLAILEEIALRMSAILEESALAIFEELVAGMSASVDVGAISEVEAIATDVVRGVLGISLS